MCLAIPGKIIQIKNDLAIVDYETEKREARIVRGNFKVGDYVMVQAKIVVEKIPKEQVKAWLEVVNKQEK
jgi:hydrogenase expression/formation protein HypC